MDTKQGKQAWSRDVPALTANIFVVVTNKTHIPNKIGAINQSIFIKIHKIRLYRFKKGFTSK